MDALLVFSFLAGFSSFFSPCSVALIPAYVGYALRGGQQNPTLVSKTKKGLFYGALTATGIIVVYLVFALAVSIVRNIVGPILFYFALGTGVLLIIAGTLMFFGKGVGLEISLPFTRRLPPNLGFLTFGLAYGLGSLGCTLPLFLLVSANALSSENFKLSFLHFIFFLGPITLLIIGFTLASFFAKVAVARFLARLTPVIVRFSPLVIILAGAYIIYFQLRAKFLL